MLLLAALFIFGLATFYVENWQTYLGEGYRLTARFPKANTLDVGDRVRMAGVTVGQVESLSIDTDVTDRPVETVLWISTGVKVRAEDTAVVRISSIFGGNYIAIDRGPQDAQVLGDGDEIQLTEVAPSMSEVIEESDHTLTQVRKAFATFDGIATEVSEGKGPLGQLIKDEELYAEIKEIVSNVQGASKRLATASERMEKGEGVLGKLLMDDELAATLDQISADAAAIAADLREGKGTIGKLLKSDELYAQFQEVASEVSQTAKQVREGEGILPKLISDEELAAEGKALVTDARAIAADLRAGKGTIGKLLVEEEVYADLTAALKDIGKAADSFVNAEGTLGLLMTDRRLHDQITGLVADIQAIIEAYREQTPTISFVGSVLGAF
jgi:phospholipid/cholesterol/gamma-HCH transport system substrate-binding protein